MLELFLLTGRTPHGYMDMDINSTTEERTEYTEYYYCYHQSEDRGAPRNLMEL